MNGDSQRTVQFQARILDRQTAVVDQVMLDAPSVEALQLLVEAQGKILLSSRAAGWRQRTLAMEAAPAGSPARSVQTARSPAVTSYFARLFKFPGASAGLDVAWWCREVRTLLLAGMTIVEALDTLNAQVMASVLGGTRQRVNEAVVARLREGQTLSSAMQACGAFPAILIAGVRASERTSNLIEALNDYVTYHTMLDRLRRQIVSAAVYPAIVSGLGLLIATFLLFFVVPRFSRIYGDLRGSMGWTTRCLLHISQTLHEHGTALFALFVMLLGALLLAWRHRLVHTVAGDLLMRIAPLRQQIDEFRLAKLYHSMALMFRGGYAFDEAMGQCLDLGLGDRIRSGVVQAQAALARGQSVSTALGNAGLSDAVSLRLLAVGERSGEFDRVLQTIADRHALNFSTFVERATRVVEPILLLGVALFVGGIVVMMYMPIFDIASSIR